MLNFDGRKLFCFYLFNHFGRHPRHDGAGGHVFGDHRSGGNDGAVAYADPGHYGGVGPYPYFFADAYGRGQGLPQA